MLEKGRKTVKKKSVIRKPVIKVSETGLEKVEIKVPEVKKVKVWVLKPNVLTLKEHALTKDGFAFVPEKSVEILTRRGIIKAR